MIREDTIIGKTEYQILKFLDRHSNSTAREISENVDVPLTGRWGGVYTILHRLKRKGVVAVITHAGPMRWYLIVPFEQIEDARR